MGSTFGASGGSRAAANLAEYNYAKGNATWNETQATLKSLGYTPATAKETKARWANSKGPRQTNKSVKKNRRKNK